MFPTLTNWVNIAHKTVLRSIWANEDRCYMEYIHVLWCYTKYVHITLDKCYIKYIHVTMDRWQETVHTFQITLDRWQKPHKIHSHYFRYMWTDVKLSRRDHMSQTDLLHMQVKSEYKSLILTWTWPTSKTISCFYFSFNKPPFNTSF